MNPAPGVLVDLGSPCKGWQRARQLLGATAAVGLMVWVDSHMRADAAQTGAFVPVLLISGLGLWLALRVLTAPTPRGQLLWNTTTWLWLSDSASLQAPSTPGRAAIAIDLGAWLLIEFTPAVAPHRKHWLPVSRGQAGPRWHAMQCALRQRAVADPTVGTPGPLPHGPHP